MLNETSVESFSIRYATVHLNIVFPYRGHKSNLIIVKNSSLGLLVQTNVADT